MASSRISPCFPTTDLVRDAITRFDNENIVVEKALSDLFALFPKNNDLPHVLLKVVTLNRLYSTQIFAVMDVALHIHQNGDVIDSALASGDPSVVDLISKVSIQGKIHNFFSFASKYCSWHYPHLYPLYDSQVDWYLWALQKQTPFHASFNKNEYADYSQFRDVVVSFRRRFGLESVTFKDIDKFLWFYGGKADAMKANLA